MVGELIVGWFNENRKRRKEVDNDMEECVRGGV